MGVRERNNVRIGGDGKDTLFFAHGFGCDQNMWRHLEPAYASRYRTVLFDLVGSGKSDLAAYDPVKYRSLQGYADDILEIVETCGQGKALFVGHSAMTYGLAEAPVTVVSTIADATFSITVHNQGAPIPPDVQSGLFHPMTRASMVGTRERSIGLGLYIVHEIAKAHGGNATVRSLPGEGTTFTVVCPRADGA